MRLPAICRPLLLASLIFCCCCFSVAQHGIASLSVYGTAMTDCSGRTHLWVFWPSANATDCAQSADVKLCLEDMKHEQGIANATVFGPEKLQTSPGQFYRLMQLPLTGRILHCSKAFNVLLELAPSNQSGWRQDTKCSGDFSRSACFIRLAADRPTCSDGGDLEGNCSMNKELPADILQLLLQRRRQQQLACASPSPPSTTLVGPVVGTTAALLVIAGFGLLAWALLSNRLDPPIETRHWEPKDLVFVDPDNIECRLLEN